MKQGLQVIFAKQLELLYVDMEHKRISTDGDGSSSPGTETKNMKRILPNLAFSDSSIQNGC